MLIQVQQYLPVQGHIISQSSRDPSLDCHGLSQQSTQQWQVPRVESEGWNYTTQQRLGMHTPQTSGGQSDRGHFDHDAKTGHGQTSRVEVRSWIKTTAPTPTISISDNTESTAVKLVRAWAKHMQVTGLDPTEDWQRMHIVATASAIDVAEFAYLVGKALQQSRDDSECSAVASSDRDERKHALATQYKADAESRGCNPNPPNKRPGGTFRCIWADCNLAYDRDCEWKRHVLARRPSPSLATADPPSPSLVLARRPSPSLALARPR